MTERAGSIGSILRKVLKKELHQQSRESDWFGAEFEDIRKLQIDSRGQIGERFIANVLQELGHKVTFSNVTDPRNKQWDLEVDGEIKLEIKTASRGLNSKTFQHENLDKNRLYDAILLLDIAPDAIYISMYSQAEFPWSKCHRRKDSIYYKYDTTVKRLEDNGKRIATLAEFKVAFDRLVSNLSLNS